MCRGATLSEAKEPEEVKEKEQKHSPPVAAAVPSTSASAVAPFNPLRWKHRFLTLGGVQHLVHILATNDFTPPASSSSPASSTLSSTSSSSASASFSTSPLLGSAANTSSTTHAHASQELECLSLLLKILLRFMVGDPVIAATASSPSPRRAPASPAAPSASTSSVSDLRSPTNKRRREEEPETEGAESTEGQLTAGFDAVTP